MGEEVDEGADLGTYNDDASRDYLGFSEKMGKAIKGETEPGSPIRGSGADLCAAANDLPAILIL